MPGLRGISPPWDAPGREQEQTGNRMGALFMATLEAAPPPSAPPPEVLAAGGDAAHDWLWVVLGCVCGAAFLALAGAYAFVNRGQRRTGDSAKVRLKDPRSGKTQTEAAPVSLPPFLLQI